MRLGEYNTLTILRITTVGAYLGDEFDNDVLLPNKYLTQQMSVGEDIKVFLYKDSEDRLVATTEKPYIVLNEFAYLKVKEVNPDGAFLDWGLEKVLLVPFREQTNNLEEVAVTADNSTRGFWSKLFHPIRTIQEAFY